MTTSEKEESTAISVLAASPDETNTAEIKAVDSPDASETPSTSSVAKEKHLDRLKLLLNKAMKFTEFVTSTLEQPSTPAPSSKKRGAKGKAKSSEEPPPFPKPKLMVGAEMRNYQLEGLRWLVSLYDNGLNGILADEMGLGKTCQTISFLAYLFENGIKGPFLIVAPLSTLNNWEREFHRFTPDIPVLLYHGSIEERATFRKKQLKYGKSNEWPVLITSYEIILKDACFLNKVSWKYIVIDEGHRMKNFNCKLVTTLKQFPSSNRLLLTGTPLQNNLAELWSLLNFLLPEVFDDLDVFESWFEMDNPDLDADASEIHQVVGNLHLMLKPFVLRRLKSDVELGVPKKREYVVYASMSDLQQTYYGRILKRHDPTLDEEQIEKLKKPVELPKKRKRQKVEYVEASDNDSFDECEDMENADPLKVDNGISETGKRHGVAYITSLQNVIMQLRKCCSHPFLFSFPRDKTGEPIVDETIVTSCGKMQLLDRLLKKLLAKGHKMLIFSQMTAVLDIIEEFCEYRKYTYRRLDGSVSHTARQQQVEEFNTDKSVSLFLLSTRAGGLGLNLTAADTVIIYDSDWNPQMDAQAMDRCHRIGQTKPVLVFRLATRNSAETRILERAAAKRRLEKLVMHKKKFKSVTAKEQPLDQDDLRAILTSESYLFSQAAATEASADLTEEQMELILDRSDEAMNRVELDGKSAFQLVPEDTQSSILKDIQ